MHQQAARPLAARHRRDLTAQRRPPVVAQRTRQPPARREARAHPEQLGRREVEPPHDRLPVEQRHRHRHPLEQRAQQLLLLPTLSAHALRAAARRRGQLLVAGPQDVRRVLQFEQRGVQRGQPLLRGQRPRGTQFVDAAAEVRQFRTEFLSPGHGHKITRSGDGQPSRSGLLSVALRP